MVKVISLDTRVQDIIDDIKNGENFLVVDKKGRYKGILSNERLIRYLFNPDIKVEKIYIKIKPIKELDFLEIGKKMIYSNSRVVPVEVDGKIELITIWELLEKLSELDKEYFKSTLAEDIMNPPVIVRERDDIKKVIALMRNKGVSRVIIVDKEERAVGILSVSDIVRYFLFKKERARKGEISEKEERLEVRALLTGELIYANPKDTLYDVIRILIQNNIFAVPILKDEKPIGIITAKDILVHYISYKDRRELPVTIHGISLDEIDVSLIKKKFNEIYRKFSKLIGKNPRLIVHIKRNKNGIKKGLKRTYYYTIKAKLISDKIKIFASESGYDFSIVVRSLFKILESELEERKERIRESYYIERLLKENLEYL